MLFCKNDVGEADYTLNKDGGKSRKKVYINSKDLIYDPVHYVTMFPRGDSGWTYDWYLTNKYRLKPTTTTTTTANKRLSDELDDLYTYVQGSNVDSDGDLDMDDIELHAPSEEVCVPDGMKEMYLSNGKEEADLSDDLDEDMRVYSHVDNNNKDIHSRAPLTENINIQNVPGNEYKRKGNNFVKCRKFYKYRYMIRENQDPDANGDNNYLHKYGKLFQQYVVDNWAKCDDNDISWWRDKKNQGTLRKAHADGLQDAINANDIESVGKPTILPSSHTGSSRWYHDKFQDAMAIIQRFKKPDLFITFTCNPKWNEISNNLFANQSAYDRPDIVSRVFRLKLDELIRDLVNRGVFGRVVANVRVVEFQKRGLPHAHILLILDKNDKFRTPEDYDKVVSAEIPDPEKTPRLYSYVMAHMLHYHTRQCYRDNTCTKFFPKDYINETTAGSDGYPAYKRRSPANGGLSVEVKKRGKTHTMTNQYVVPYSAKLLLKYNCHINVEICSTIRSVKYLYKYVYKGNDRTMAKLTGKKKELKNEIQQYIDCRYISSIEGAYRTFEFTLHARAPTVLPLMVHLPGRTNVTYDTEDTIANIKEAIKKSRKTTLNAWFKNNAKELAAVKNGKLPRYLDDDDNPEPYGYELLYRQYPEYYTYTSGKWKRRTDKSSWAIGRVHSAYSSEGSRWFLRILLNNVRGSTSFIDLLTYEGEIYNCFKKRCLAECLLQDDKEYDKAMDEAKLCKHPCAMRRMFATMLKDCNVNEPLILYNKYKLAMIEDMEHTHRRAHTIDDLTDLAPELLEKMCNTSLYEICTILEQYNVQSVKYEGLIKPEKSMCWKLESKDMVNEHSYNKVDCINEYMEKFKAMNCEQQRVFIKLVKSIYPDDNIDELLKYLKRDRTGVCQIFLFSINKYINIYLYI